MMMTRSDGRHTLARLAIVVWIEASVGCERDGRLVRGWKILAGWMDEKQSCGGC